MMAAGFAVLLAVSTPASANSDITRESPEQRFAREAVQALRESTFLLTPCESAFLDFWRIYISDGPKTLIKEPSGNPEEPYFGYGNAKAAPLLEIAQYECEAATGARGDLVVRVLKEREKKKWQRAQKLQHAERIIGY